MNSINWIGNRVVDPATGASVQRSAAYSVPAPAAALDQGLTLQGPPPLSEKGYIPYYLAQNIGKNVRAEFIIGTTQYADKTGKLTEVGVNYFVLEDVNSRTLVMCDLYSVKFVTILQD